MQKHIKHWNPERNWTYKPFMRKWRNRTAMYWLMPFELAGTVALLVLFAIAQPDLFRTQLWTIGWVWGFNSNPAMLLYAKANHQPAPHVPFVWSLNLTNYNVGISVASLFALLAKLVGLIMRAWPPLLGAAASAALAALYAASVYGQMGPDRADPAHPSPLAWYVRYGCAPAAGFPDHALARCRLAVAAYAVTVAMLALYLACLACAAHSMVPTAAERAAAAAAAAARRGAGKNEGAAAGDGDHGDDGDAASDNGMVVSENKVVFEMVPPPPPPAQQQPGSFTPGLFNPGLYTPAQHGVFTPGQSYTPAAHGQFTPGPFTPRAQAFHTMDRRLPLRGD